MKTVFIIALSIDRAAWKTSRKMIFGIHFSHTNRKFRREKREFVGRVHGAIFPPQESSQGPGLGWGQGSGIGFRLHPRINILTTIWQAGPVHAPI